MDTEQLERFQPIWSNVKSTGSIDVLLLHSTKVFFSLVHNVQNNCDVQLYQIYWRISSGKLTKPSSIVQDQMGNSQTKLYSAADLLYLDALHFFFVLQSYLLTNFNNSKKMLEFHSRKATSIQFLVNLVRKTPARCEQWLLLKRWMWTLQLAVVSSEWGGIFKLKGEERKALRNFLWGFSFPFYAYALCS